MQNPVIYLYRKAVYQGFGCLNHLPLWQMKVRVLALLTIAHQVLKYSVELNSSSAPYKENN